MKTLISKIKGALNAFENTSYTKEEMIKELREMIKKAEVVK